MTIILFILGLLFLVAGAEALVRGASSLAGRVGISPLVIGLTVVAFGTSAPEMAVSAAASLNGQYDLAMGNVVGSNIFNVLFILGVSALIMPLAVSAQLIRIDVPLMIALSVLLLLLGWDGNIQQWEAALLFAGIVIYTVLLIRQSRKEHVMNVTPSDVPASGSVWLNGAYIIGGLTLLVLGSGWLVDSAIAFANYFGVSERIIGLTIVAAGTSLPELATSVLASIRGERDIAVGNVVGSNIFNILAVLGLSGMISPIGLTVSASTLSFDLPVMILAAAICLPLFFTGFKISRWEGGFFLMSYIAYTLWLIR